MDFARKQLEKYGWTDGQGLGKHMNGISEALKPKLKRSVTGVGHDPAAEFNEHWWTTLYDKASGNVEVENKNGKTKKIKRKDDNEFEITNSMWKLNMKKKKSENHDQYTENFVKTAVLTSGGVKTEKVVESESEEDVEEKRNVFKMTDEELFQACEGRTAHKGARHGLRALGKLARIAEQEAMLLTESKYNGYSHSKNIKDKIQTVEEISLNNDSEGISHKKKKKKRKRCYSNEVSITSNAQSIDCELAQSIEESAPEKKVLTGNDDVASVDENGRKHKKKSLIDEDIQNAVKAENKKRKQDKEIVDVHASDMEINSLENVKVTKSKKKKK